MALRGSLARSVLTAARSAPASHRSPSALPRLRPPVQRRRLSFSPLRSPAALGCVQSLLPLHSLVSGTALTSHMSVSARACCELSQGRSGKDG